MKFEIYQEKKAVHTGSLLGDLMLGSKGTRRWRLLGSNGEPLAHGEDYVNKTDCEHVVNLVKSTTLLTPIFYI